MKEETTGLYIHVPFCFSRCSYCAFYSTSEADSPLINRYALEIAEEVRNLMKQREKPYRTVYIGGGNPGMLPVQALTSLAQILTQKGGVEEFTIEMNPESLTDRMVSIFDHGFNRLSVGIQSLHERHLRTLGRSASLSATLRSLSTMRRLHLDKQIALSADLMTCVPSQSIQDSISDIDRLLEALPLGHLSLYNLTYEEGTDLVRQRSRGDLKPFNEEMEREMLLTLWDYLEKQGLHQYEISNFSGSASMRSKHNQLYWSDGLYDAVGPTAVGVIEREGVRYRSTGAPDLETYISTPADRRYKLQELNRSERIAEYILSAVRTTDGIDIGYMKEAFSFDFLDTCATQRAQIPASFWRRESLDRGRFSLTKEGLMLCDSITRLFLNAL